MLAIESYKLAYDGAGMHEILGLTKASITPTQNRQIAEYFLRKLDYAANARSVASYALRNQTVTARNNPTADYVRHIHAAKREEIESKWTMPQLTDDEVSELLYADKLEKEIAKMPAKINIEIPCRI